MPPYMFKVVRVPFKTSFKDLLWVWIGLYYIAVELPVNAAIGSIPRSGLELTGELTGGFPVPYWWLTNWMNENFGAS